MTQTESNLFSSDEEGAGLTPPKERMVRIELEENENIPPTGQFFSLNGRSFMLRPGEPADVPEAIINILNDAVMSVPFVDPLTSQVLGYRNRKRFPYTVLNPR